MTATYLVGDVFDRLKGLPANSVDLVMTSPPFLALRSYLPPDHPDKCREIGAEPSPARFIDTLLALVAELDRVLAPHGSICIELGDTYAGSGGAGGDYRAGKMREGTPRFDGSAARGRRGDEWPLPKSLTGVPTLFAWSLAYGRNLLTGEESPAGKWRIRNIVHWVRPNPPVGRLGDKFRPATSYLVVACRNKSRFFDLDAVRQPPKPHTLKYPRNAPHYKNDGYGVASRGDKGRIASNAGNVNGAPPLDWWHISTRGYRGSHYAVYPPDLCERPIRSMCPERVCTECGEVGWTDCGHSAWRRGVVLDPFAGSGTTLLVAEDNGRDSIGIDLDKRNEALALQRVPSLVVEREAA